MSENNDDVQVRRTQEASRRVDTREKRMQKLVPEARELLEAKKIGITYMEDVVGLASSEAQIAVARALSEGRIETTSVHKALAGSASSGYRRKILAICGVRVADEPQ